MLFFFRASVAGPPAVGMGVNDPQEGGMISRGGSGDQSPPALVPSSQDLCTPRTTATKASRPFLISNIMGLQEERRENSQGGGQVSPQPSPSPTLPMHPHHHLGHQLSPHSSHLSQHGVGGMGGEDDGGMGGDDSPGHSPGPDSDSELAGDEDSLAKVNRFKNI